MKTTLRLTASLCLLMFTFTLASSAAENYFYVGGWYAGVHPHCVAFDSVGNVYVSIHYEDCVRKFTPDGQLLAQFGDGQLGAPSGIAIDDADNVYVAAVDDFRISKFKSDGTFVTSWGTLGDGDGQFGGPYGPYPLAVDSGGNVFAGDTYNYRIEKFDANGLFLQKWGSQGSGDGQFGINYYGLAVDKQGNIYTSESDNNRVQKFTSSGGFILKWGGTGTNDGQFQFASGIGVDPQNNVYVADALNNRIQKFDPNGRLITAWGSSGTGPGQFDAPIGVGVDGAGLVYVVDHLNSRVQKFADWTNQPPVIWLQPVSQVLYVGETAQLSVNASGTWPLIYQWRKDGGALSGQTKSTLALTNFNLPDSGDYTVVVTNNFGSVTSAVARVTVTTTMPAVSLIKAVKPSFSNLLLGHNYQMQVSGDLTTWTNQGWPFTATDTNIVWTEFFEVDNWSSLYFRLQVVP